MKRWIIALVLTVLLLCLTACGDRMVTLQPSQQTVTTLAEQTTTQAITEATIQTVAEATTQTTGETTTQTQVQVINPVEEYSSLEELSEAINAAMIKPESAEVSDETFWMINGDPKIAEYRFTLDGKQCTLRTGNAGIDNDISGVYLDTGTVFEGSEAETHYYEIDGMKLQRWFSVDGQYVFAVADDNEWEWEQFDAICAQFMKMEPENWDADVPFADYLALTGYYKDGENCIASVDMKGDHVIVSISRSDGEVNYLWEAEATLKDNKLIYENEKSELHSYTPEGKDQVTPGDASGAGYIELQDGALVLSGVNAEEIKNLILNPVELASLFE